jgi:hypothetical protein
VTTRDRELVEARTAYVAAWRRLEQALHGFHAVGVPLDPGPSHEPVPWGREHVRAVSAVATAWTDLVRTRKRWDGLRHGYHPPH